MHSVSSHAWNNKRVVYIYRHLCIENVCFGIQKLCEMNAAAELLIWNVVISRGASHCLEVFIWNRSVSLTTLQLASFLTEKLNNKPVIRQLSCVTILHLYRS